MQRQDEEEDADSPEALGRFLVRLSGLADEGWEPALLVLEGHTLSVFRRASHREQVCFVIECVLCLGFDRETE